MMQRLREWCDHAWTRVEHLPGGVGADLRARWDAHASREQIVVTLFGPYDSGKSSLLKRLLVDDGRSVPDWLTISGRRETFEPKEIAVRGAVVRDTPGIAGGNALHEAIAKEALLLSDVIVLVLPPQLITSDRDSLAAVLSGQRFGCSAGHAFPTRGLPIVLSRMDEAGAMPREDIQGYNELVERKGKELAEFLRSVGGTEAVVAFHAVAADPFGLVGNAQPSGPQEYDADRSWDGMADLAASLEDFSRNKELFRLHAEVRFLGAEITEVGRALERMATENRIAFEATTNEATAHELVQERLRAVFGAARADLDRRIEDEVSASSMRSAADVNELRGAVHDRLTEALERWEKEHDSAVAALMREADAELQVRRSRPAWKDVTSVLDDVTISPTNAPSAKEVRQAVDKMERVARTLHKGFRDAQPLVLGMPLEKAGQELRKLGQVGSFEEYAKQARSGASRLKDAAHAKQARRAILVDTGFEAALPAIVELGGLLAEAWAENKTAEQRAKRREEIRKVIEHSTKKLADRAWKLWADEGLPSALGEALTRARDSAETAASSFRSEGELMAATLEELNSMLAELKVAD